MMEMKEKGKRVSVCFGKKERARSRAKSSSFLSIGAHFKTTNIKEIIK